MGELTAKKD